jgi:hypothetical protein
MVRVKLNITQQADPSQVKNLWMSLNYDQKPTIAHIVEHIRNHFLQDDLSAHKKGDETELVKLFLDDYWLPPYENSRLLKENDCIK